MTEEDPLIYVRRHPGDWRVAAVRLSSLSGIGWDCMCGGLNIFTQTVLYGYIFCNAIESGELAHSCRHGPGPHNIKVCMLQVDNEKHVHDALEWYARIPSRDQRKRLADAQAWIKAALPRRVARLLQRHGMQTPRELFEMSPTDIAAFPGVGPKTCDILLAYRSEHPADVTT